MDDSLYYRADPDDARPIDVLVMLPGQPPSRGRVIDVYVDGIGVRVPRSMSLPLGTEVELGLRVPDAARPVALSAVAVGRREGRSFRRYSFRFTSREEIEERIPQGLYSIFNRRRAERYHLTEALDVEVIPGGRYETLPAKLRDVSLVGAALVVDPKLENVLASTDRVQLCLEPNALRSLDNEESAPPTEPLVLDAVVHNRLLLPDGVRYGCELNPSKVDTDDKARRLVALVLSAEGARLGDDG